MDIITRIKKAMEGNKSKVLTVRDTVTHYSDVVVYELWGTPILIKDKTDGKVYVNLSSNMDDGNYYRYGRNVYPPVSHTTKDRLNGLAGLSLSQYRWKLYESCFLAREATDSPLELDEWYEVVEGHLSLIGPELKLLGHTFRV